MSNSNNISELRGQKSALSALRIMERFKTTQSLDEIDVQLNRIDKVLCDIDTAKNSINEIASATAFIQETVDILRGYLETTRRD